MRLSGIARRTRDVPHPPDAPSTLLERTIVTTPNGPLGKIETLEPFDLELADGEHVRVEIAQHLRLEPVDARDAQWGDIESDSSFAPLRASAPGPHVKVHIRRSCVEVGTRIELLAQDDDVQHMFETRGGHRDAPTRKLTTVTARVIASGPDAAGIITRLIEPPPAPKPQVAPKRQKTPSKFVAQTSLTPVVFCSLGLLCFIVAGLIATIKLAPLSVDIAVLGVVFVCGALSSWALSRVPRFVSDGKVVGGKLGDDFGRIVLFTMIFPISFIVFPLFADYAGPWQPANAPVDQVHNASWISVVSLAAWSLLVAYFAISRGGAEARLFRVLLGAPALPATGPLARTWGSFEGVVRDPTPVNVEGEAVAIVHVVSEEVKPGSDPNIYTERVLSKGTFFVDAPDGGGHSIEIHPDGAVWASSVALSVPRVAKNLGSRTVVVEHLRAVPLRGSVLVAGRVDREGNSKVGRVASAGSESLLFVAVREGHSARSECHAMLFLRRLALLVAVAALGIAVGTVMFVEPQLPKFQIPEGGGD